MGGDRMRENTILFPVCGTLYPYRISHQAFWLARYLQAKLYLAEVLLPTGWMGWLLALFRKKDRRWRFHEVEKLVLQQDQIECEVEAVEVPNLTIGIVEAAWRLRPNLIVIMPELQERLGKSGLTELKTRLGEMGRYMLVLLKNGPIIRVEPCNTVDSLDAGRVIHAKFG
jgi:hypothetical protein